MFRLSFLRIPIWPWGQINVKFKSEVMLWSERNKLIPTMTIGPFRLSWRKWRKY